MSKETVQFVEMIRGAYSQLSQPVLWCAVCKKELPFKIIQSKNSAHLTGKCTCCGHYKLQKKDEL